MKKIVILMKPKRKRNIIKTNLIHRIVWP